MANLGAQSKGFRDRCQYQKEAIQRFVNQLAYTRETGDEIGDLGNAIAILWDAGVVPYPGDQEAISTSQDISRLFGMASNIDRLLHDQWL